LRLLVSEGAITLEMQRRSYSPTDMDYGLLSFARFVGARSISHMAGCM